jgi:hypothetical protein
MATKNTETIHELATAEIGRQLTVLAERDRQITNELADRYKNAIKNGGAIPIVDPDEQAARAHARSLLNGAAPESLSLAPELNRDKILYREKRGIAIATKILMSKDLVARAVEAVRWAEEHDGEWRTLCRDIVLTAIRLGALEDRSQRLLGQCIDVSSIRLPMANKIGGRAISETPIAELTEIALAAGIITLSEIKKSKAVVP